MSPETTSTMTTTSAMINDIKLLFAGDDAGTSADDVNIDWKKRLKESEASLAEAIALKEDLELQLAQVVEDVNRLTSEVQVARLVVPSRWNTNFHKLIAYRKQHGNCDVPHDYPQDKGLGHFVANQRSRYKHYLNGDTKNMAGAYRIEALNKLGFVWNTVKDTFTQNMQLLLEYKETHGTTDVPPDFANKKLARFVSELRTEYRKYQRQMPCKMTPERIERLNEIGFLWERPQKPPKNPADGSQSRKRKAGETARPTSRGRKSRAYHGKTPDEVWDMRFAQLTQFYEANGHCRVRQRSLSENWKKFVQENKLKEWNAFQRRLQLQKLEGKESFMTQEQMDKLNSIGFEWTIPNSVPHKPA